MATRAPFTVPVDDHHTMFMGFVRLGAGQEEQVIPTYSNHTVIPVPKAPTPEAEDQLLRETGRHVAEGYLNDHASLVEHMA
jgi:hypothetical protein